MARIGTQRHGGGNNLKNNPEDEINQQTFSSAPGLASIYTAYFSSCKKCTINFD
jgi:hypothetical protein